MSMATEPTGPPGWQRSSNSRAAGSVRRDPEQPSRGRGVERAGSSWIESQAVDEATRERIETAPGGAAVGAHPDAVRAGVDGVPGAGGNAEGTDSDRSSAPALQPRPGGAMVGAAVAGTAVSSASAPRRRRQREMSRRPRVRGEGLDEAIGWQIRSRPSR